jgi:Putative Ig domain
VLALGLLAAPAHAGSYQGVKIEWCWDPILPSTFPILQSFYIEVIYPSLGLGVGDTVVETFDFGDGTSAPVTLTVSEIRGDGAVAQGTILNHQYPTGIRFVWAGLRDCCRSGALNNRDGGEVAARVLVYVQGEELCSPAAALPGTIWLSGDLGDTFQIPLPVDLGSGPNSYSPVFCRLATDAEAGGGPHPDGLSVDPATCTLTWTPTGGDPGRLWTTQVQAQQYLSWGQFLVATTALDFTLGLDPDAPVCDPAGAGIVAQDARSGIARIEVLETVNATVQIPAFTPGSTEPLTITGARAAAPRASRVRLRVTDVAGNATECRLKLSKKN